LLRSKAFPSSIGELVNAASALKLEHDRAVPEPAQVIQDTAREAAAASGLPTGQDPSSASDKQGASPHPQHGSRRAETKSPLAEPFPDDPLDRGLSTHIELRAIKQKITKVLHALNKKSNIRVGWHPREVALQMGRVTLYRYLSPRGRPQRKSLLIVYALVNRPYMIDLEKDRSLIRGFLEAGLDVYLVDWGYPGHQDCDLGIEDYVLDYLDRCVDRVLRDSGCAKVNLLGICQGGVLTLCYSALRPEKIGTLVTMVTPTDFSARSSLLAKLVRKIDVDQLVAAFGNVPGDLLSAMFVSLSPHRLGSQKYLRLLDLLDDEAAWSNFLRMEQWIFDSPDQAGKAFRQFVGEFIQKNGLIRGKIHIGGERVDLGHIEVPVLNIYAIQDHLVPAVCAKALGRYVGSRDYTEYAFPGGHIGVYVSRKAQLEIPPRIAAWLQTR
jgi:polyhydroxyalkanoate synthase